VINSLPGSTVLKNLKNQAAIPHVLLDLQGLLIFAIGTTGKEKKNLIFFLFLSLLPKSNTKKFKQQK